MQLQNQQFYIYGAGIFGKALADTFLAAGLKPTAFLDRAPKTAAYRDIPIQQFEKAVSPTNFPVLVTVLGYPGTETSILEAGFLQVYNAIEVMSLFPAAVAALNQCGFLWMQAPASLQYNDKACSTFSALLADEHSKYTFKQICNFRQYPSAEHYPQPETYEMYFPPEIPRLYDYPLLRLLDVGAFDGDSLAGFYRRWPDRLAAYTGIEISTQNIAAFWQRIERLGMSSERIKLIKGAVGVPTGRQLMIEENKSATRIKLLSQDEDCPAAQLVDSYDLGVIAAEMDCNVLKMDIEGADSAALLQALPYIIRHTPTLALSVYHQPEDLWQMALSVEQACPGKYLWYLRQEGHWGLETICYGVPMSI